MFKRAKTIGLTLVGLLAMLGTKAEAHYMYANGEWVSHSVGCQITELDSVGTASWAAACLVVPTKVDVRCQNLSIVNSLAISGVTLVGPTILNLQGQPPAEGVEVTVDDAPLLEVSTVVNACLFYGSTPSDVLIREMESTISLFKCDSLVGCSVLLLTGTAAAECSLSTYYHLDNPPNGAAFSCTEPVKVHLLH